MSGAVAQLLTRLSREPAANEAHMSPIHETEQARPQYRRLLRGSMILLALVIIGRFVLEAAGVPLDTTRFLSASVAGALAIIYVGAVAPLRGVTRFKQLALPALVLSAWVGGWTALAMIISGVRAIRFAQPTPICCGHGRKATTAAPGRGRLPAQPH